MYDTIEGGQLNGTYHAREMGVDIKFGYDTISECYEATSPDVCELKTTAFSRDAAIKAWIDKYNSTWTNHRINILKRRVQLACDPDLASALHDALTDLNEFSMKAQTSEHIQEAFDSEFDVDEHFRLRKKADLHGYWAATLFLISVAAATSIIEILFR